MTETDDPQERGVIISLADVEAVLGPEFFRRGTVYFDGVWSQAKAADQRLMLRTAAQRAEPWALGELEAATGLMPAALQAALAWAERHDILKPADETPPAWAFHVPLLRGWIAERAPA